MGKELPGDYYLRAITLDKLKMKPQAIAAYQQFLATDNGAAPGLGISCPAANPYH